MPELLQLFESWDGYIPIRSRKLNEAATARLLNLITNADGLPAHKREYLLKETITTSDFPALFGGIIDHTLLAKYRSAPSPWRSYVKIGRAKDFRVRDISKVQGQNTLLPLVAEKAEYPLTTSVEAHYTNQVFKRGRQFDISWEARVNDYLDAFGDVPQLFADAALNTEAILASQLYCGAAAPSAALFGAPIADIDGANVTNLGILPLTVANLQTTMMLMTAQVDVNNIPLGARAVHLVVPPALEITARQILTSALVQQVDTAGGANAVPTTFIPLPTTNVLPQMGIQLHVDPWIPIVMPVAAANRTWFLFADQSQAPSMEMDFLTGYETPEVVMKASNKMFTGGGMASPFDGDFETDNVQYRVRHVLGGTALDPRFAYAQVGP
jgi:hypothetical protein